MRWLRALAVWLAIVVAETLHGIARTLWLTPIVGDHAARQIGVGTGSVLIFTRTKAATWKLKRSLEQMGQFLEALVFGWGVGPAA